VGFELILSTSGKRFTKKRGNNSLDVLIKNDGAREVLIRKTKEMEKDRARGRLSILTQRFKT
jgi:hypothetical protein